MRDLPLQPVTLIASFLLAFGLTAITHDVANAQSIDTKPQVDETIVVTGNRRTRSKKIRQVSRFSRQEEGVFPRFRDELCPMIVGAPLPARDAIKAKLRAVSRDLGLNDPKPDCIINLVVAISPPGQGGALVGRMFKDRKGYFPDSADEKSALMNDGGPVWSWHITEIKQSNGVPVRSISSISIGGQERFLGKGAYALVNGSSPRLGSPVRSDIESAFIVFDGTKAKSLGTNRLSGLVAMLALTRIDTRKVDDTAQSTILSNIYKNDSDVENLTSFDLTYLKSIYCSGRGTTASSVLQSIADGEGGRITCKHNN